MSKGRLQVGAFAADEGRPASGAVVRVMLKGDHSQVLEELTADNSGQTPVIELEAPPVEYSLTGENKPYSEYDVEIIMDGYVSQIVEGVQIISDATAYQDVTLKPITDDGGQAEVIHIREHSLWGTYPPKDPEDEVKPLPPSTGYVVLPNPVVPQYVVVHDGVPDNAAAPNYWIPFADYIKNVASSEIYPTWPRAAITANVLAILSFTLNRVYTEWYRGKGYGFTVTSSTIYDHAFSYRRDIFKEISSVVDDIFTSFITRPGIRQPLLAQYCDGRKVTCPRWMTQWGSKDLGDKGYTAIDILRHYYGRNVYLMQARKVDGTPRSYPGRAIRTGASGANVRVIQEQLNAVGKNFPAVPSVRGDGAFGRQTRAAVEAFQRIFRLDADGVVGFNTWYKLSHVYVAVTRMAEL